MTKRLKEKIYGLVGFPIKHSLSPRMHNAAIMDLKIKAKYKLFEVAPQDFKCFLQNLKKENVCGFNVTYPYKEEILGFLKTKSLEVKKIGAANTVVVDRGGRLHGFNTDGLGFIQHLKELKLLPKKVALIGAGGAAKAVGYALGKLKVKELCIYDQDKFKALGLFKKLNSQFKGTKFDVVGGIQELNLAQKDLLINATPVGMRALDPLLVTRSALHSGLFVYDLIYSPAKTKLLVLAKEMNLKFANGLGMLFYQGVFAFRIFMGKNPRLKVMQEALRKGAKG